MGVVYHANYLIWCEIGRTDFIRELGTSYAQLEREGVMLAVSVAALRFHASARYDDPVRIVTRLTDVRSRAMTFAYRILNTDTNQLLVSGTTGLISLTKKGRLASLPSPIRETLQAAVSQQTKESV